MLFDEAKRQIVFFGKYTGKTIDKIAETDEGLKYLDWIVGQDWLYDGTREAIKVYLADDTIKSELEKLL